VLAGHFFGVPAARRVLRLRPGFSWSSVARRSHADRWLSTSAAVVTGLMPSAQNTWARHPRATATTIVATVNALTVLGMRITMPLQVS
jgi:hypothetical protein